MANQISILIALLLLAGCASSQKAKSKIATPTDYEETIILTAERVEDRWQVRWTRTSTNFMVPEWSTNLVNWQRTGNETIEADGTPYGTHYTSTGTNWTDRFFVRLKRFIPL